MKTIVFYTQELKASEARLRVLTEQGARALSRYDIVITHQRDAAAAIRTAKGLIGNHIKYSTRLNAEMEKEPAQLVLL
jgi:hypothetical protein